jgi:two-component sensor histidine kinase
MIVAELLVNAARRAFNDAGGAVDVELFGRAGDIVCAIRNDGWGWPDRPAAWTVRGSTMVRLLVQEIGGQLRTASSAAATSVELVVPRVETSWVA